MTYAPKPPTCSGCPAAEWGVGFCPPAIPKNPRMVLVGQGPGQQEVWNSRPFFHLAPIGERLNKWLFRSGWSRTWLSIGNLVQCWLPKTKRQGSPDGNREPTRAEMEWCWNAHVGPWLQSHEGLIVVPVGIPAARFLLGIPEGKGAEKFLGTMNDVDLPPIGRNKEC